MITAEDILEAGRRHGLSLADDLVEMAAAQMADRPQPAAMALASGPALSQIDDADIAARLDLAPSARGALDGFTIAIKDNIAVAGAPMRLGSGLPGWLPSPHATIVERLLASGARLTAKAQCEAFLLGANSFTSRPAPVPNPHDPRRSAGGSSSGSASLVARRACRAAIGTDSGGSIRIPAAFCGIVGFKPSRGAVPYTGIAPLEPYLEAAGPMGTCVADIAAMFEVIAGADGRDCRSGWLAPRASDRAMHSVRGRLALPMKWLDIVAPHAREAFEGIVSALRTAAFEIDEIDLDVLERANDAHFTIYAIGQAATLLTDHGSSPLASSEPDGWRAWWRGIDRTSLPIELAVSLALGAAWAQCQPDAYARALSESRSIAGAIDNVLNAYDALILPTTTDIAPMIPAGAPDLQEVFGDTRLTAPFNMSGHPAISLPSSKIGGMPFGMQLVGARGADRELLDLAARLERALPPISPPFAISRQDAPT